MTHHRPKPYSLLVLTSQLPYPPHQGATIRSFNLLRELSRNAEIDLLSFVSHADEVSQAGPLHAMCRHIAWDLTPQRSMRQRALATLFSPQPDMALRFASPRFSALLADFLENRRYDAILGACIDVGRYVLEAIERCRRLPQDAPRPRILFDDNNAEYLLQRRAFETDLRGAYHPRRLAGALYSFIQWHKLRRFERRLCREADYVTAVSEADRLALRRLAPGRDIIVVPNGVDLDYYRPLPPADPPLLPSPSLVFTGKMDFRPNVDAVCWFCEEVLPLVRRAHPHIPFYIVGRNPHPRVQRLAEIPDVIVTGYVPDDRPYFAEATVYVVPLRVGGGTRLKILSAMAMEKAMVTTSLGCEGLGLEDGRHALIADVPADFAQAVSRLLSNPALRAQLGAEARRCVEAQYSWSAIAPRLEGLYVR